jgi:hypothetical protein
MALDPVPSEAPPQPSPEPSSAGFLRVLAAVFSSFLGVRKKAAGERDMVTIKPAHVIVAGVLGAAILVAALVALVSLITRKG